MHLGLIVIIARPPLTLPLWPYLVRARDPLPQASARRWCQLSVTSSTADSIQPVRGAGLPPRLPLVFAGYLLQGPVIDRN